MKDKKKVNKKKRLIHIRNKDSKSFKQAAKLHLGHAALYTRKSSLFFNILYNGLQTFMFAMSSIFFWFDIYFVSRLRSVV